MNTQSTEWITPFDCITSQIREHIGQHGLVLGLEQPFDGALAAYDVFDSDDDDITYFYESQLPSEAQPIEDRHFHPVEPRTFRLTVETRF